MVPKHQNAITVTCSSGCQWPRGTSWDHGSSVNEFTEQQQNPLSVLLLSAEDLTGTIAGTEERLIQKKWAHF